MSAITTDPIPAHWITKNDRATVRELVDRLATVELDELGRHRRALAAAVDELHREAGSELRWEERDPPASLLRAVARLERRSPLAGSSAARELLRRLPADRRM